MPGFCAVHHSARFLKVLYIYRLTNKIREWICLKLNTQNLLDYNSNIFPLITLLFKLFHESGAILNEFGMHNSEFLKFELDESFHSLEQNMQFYSRLQHLTLDIILDFGIENIAKFLRVLAKNTTKIGALRLVFHSGYESKLIHTLSPALIHFIKSQEQLRKFILNGNDDCPTEFYGIISALESQKDTLQEVTLEDCVFSAEFSLRY
ncbi:hypothetical protein F8M41_019672 [Gigaspora margarita]|uniref:Uncharacterized protein n=1 Tax=Gigaspora margarita TaxID=4874 RepID=A0A8H4AJN3_GIGMA|nr:hypothetical protein F8M41_019672 [Gigaspora margarita]